MTTPHTIAITGASGLVGRHLCNYFRRGGWTVRALMRNPDAYPFSEADIERYPMRLPDEIDERALADASVLVHSAWSTRGERGGTRTARRVNEEGTRRLLEAARRLGVPRVIFVSSFSAITGASSYYARSKAAVEEMLDPNRDLVIRPGLVLAADGGMGTRLWEFLARRRIAPLFDGGRQIVQTLHVDDLCNAFNRAISLDLRGSVNVAEPVGLPMRELMALMAREVHVTYREIAVPASLVSSALRVLESIGVPLPVSADSILGLVALRPVPTEADLLRLDIEVHDAHETIALLAPMLPFARRSPGA